jgi:hypothetical protein
MDYLPVFLIGQSLPLIRHACGVPPSPRGRLIKKPARKSGPCFFQLTFKTSGLAVHILDNDIEDFAFGCAIFKHFPRGVGVVMEFDEFFIADYDKAVAGDFFHEIIVDFILIKVGSFDKKLCVVSVFGFFH